MWKADADSDIRFLSIYEMSGGETVYCSPCVGRHCDECHTDRDLYRVCPGCGSKLPDTAILYECSCGTAILTCGGRQHGFVHAYATPHPMFGVEEDVI